MSRRRTGARGFSLIEFVLASLIFATCFLAVVSVYPFSVRAVEQAKFRMVANHLAKREMESAIATPFDQQVNASSSTSLLSRNNGVQQVVSFSVQRTVNRVSANLYDVSTQVSWSEGSPGSSAATIRYVKLESLLHK